MVLKDLSKIDRGVPMHCPQRPAAGNEFHSHNCWSWESQRPGAWCFWNQNMFIPDPERAALLDPFGAGGAMPFQKNLRDLADFTGSFSRSGRQLDIRQAGHFATVHADKMGMIIVVGVGTLDLKTPDVISKFRPAHQARFGQIVEVPENRRLVKTSRNQPFRQVRVRERSGGGLQFQKHRNPGRRAPQTRGPQDFTGLIYLIRCRATGSHVNVSGGIKSSSALFTI